MGKGVISLEAKVAFPARLVSLRSLWRIVALMLNAVDRLDYEALEKSLIQVLKPLIRIGVKRGLDYGQFSEAVKRAFVDVIHDDFRVPGRRLTVSRISVLTGLTRREASRLVKARTETQDESSPRRRFNRAGRVFDAWHTDPRFADEVGHPRPLSLEGGGGDFADLVRRHGADVPARAVLDELVRVGAVDQDEDGRFRPAERAYVPHLDESEKLSILGADVADLIGAIDHNMTPDSGEPFFQRKVAYDNLPADYLPKLRDLIRQDAQALLEALSREMAAQDRDVISSSEGEQETDRHRAMIGIYYFEEECDEAE